MHHFGEASKGRRGFVQRVKHSMTFKFVFTGDHGASSMTLEMRNVHGEMVQVRGYSSKILNESIIHSCLFQLQPISLCYANLRKISGLLQSRRIMAALKSTYVIESSFSFTSIIDMKRILKKVFKSKKPSLGSIHASRLVPATLTPTSTGATDLMLSIPACDSESDETTSTQVAAGINVSLQLCSLHL